MHTEDLNTGTIADLTYGTVIENGDHKVIIGDTDTVAFTDSFGNWQVATGVHWDAIENGARFETLLQRKKINDVISREWPEGTADEFYSESSDNAVIIDNHGTMFHVFPDGAVRAFR